MLCVLACSTASSLGCYLPLNTHCRIRPGLLRERRNGVGGALCLGQRRGQQLGRSSTPAKGRGGVPHLRSRLACGDQAAALQSRAVSLAAGPRKGSGLSSRGARCMRSSAPPACLLACLSSASFGHPFAPLLQLPGMREQHAQRKHPAGGAAGGPHIGHVLACSPCWPVHQGCLAARRPPACPPAAGPHGSFSLSAYLRARLPCSRFHLGGMPWPPLACAPVTFCG